ncbi:MAG: hypothetical protein QM757_38500, partial [Paludibaculum sp.]
MISVPLGEQGRFAAVMAVAGQPLEALDFTKAPDIPFLFVQGGADEVFNVTAARRLAFVLQRRYKQFEYVEDGPSNHAAVGVVSLGAVRILSCFPMAASNTCSQGYTTQ